MYITPMDESWTTFTNVKESCFTRLAHWVQNNFHTVYDIWTHVILVLHTKNTGWWVFITILGKTINMKRVLLFFFFFFYILFISLLVNNIHGQKWCFLALLKLGGNSKHQLLVAVTDKYAHVWVFALY